jgi:hypothetical protein
VNGEPPALDKSAVAPRVTWGFAIIIATGIVSATIFGQKVNDVADRQKKYIGQGGAITEELRTLHDIVHDLELRITILETTQ